MNKGIGTKIILLLTIIVLGGCASGGTPLPVNSDDKPILSAAEAQSMIRVTVRTLPPVDHATIVAAID